VRHLLVQQIQVLIKLPEQVHLLQVVVQVAEQIAVAVAAALAVHLERIKVRAASASQRVEKRYAMNSIICKHHNLVEQLFLTVMAKLKFACVAVHHLQTLQRKLVQIQQHS
jgi:hypothetical protein